MCTFWSICYFENFGYPHNKLCGADEIPCGKTWDQIQIEALKSLRKLMESKGINLNFIFK